MECAQRNRSRSPLLHQHVLTLSPPPRHDRRSSEWPGPCGDSNDSAPAGESIPSPTILGPTVGGSSSFIRDRYGEYIHVGQSSNLWFVQALRDSIRGALASCSFANDPSECDLVDDDPYQPVDWIRDNVIPQPPSEEDARYCIRWYATATNCVFDLYSREKLIEDIIPWLSAPNSSDSRSCINYLVLAIGAQCGPQDLEEKSNSYFTHGRHLAMSYFFETPSITTVQIYSLLAMYLLNSSRRNAASMHLGVAVRTAYALGIHRSDIAARFSAEEESFRERVWRVLRVLDLFLSTTLGHGPSTSETRDTGSQRGYSASNDLCYIFERILCEVYDKQELPSSALQRVSKHHREWATRFHNGLHVDHISADEYIDAESGQKAPNIGLYHLKAAYYWTVMLVSLPYMLELIKSRISIFNKPFSPTSANLWFEALPQHDTMLARAAVNSAVLTIDLLRGLLHAKEIPKRLPYIVNEIFTSSLLLGASFFADLDFVFPVKEALLTAEKLLNRFVQHDSLARRELSIVQSLHSACNDFVKQRQDRWLEHQRILVQGLFGDIKTCKQNRRTSESSRSPVHTLYLRETGLGTRHVHDNFVDSEPIQPPADSQYEINSMWDDLFGDDAPAQIYGLETQQAETGDQPMELSSLLPFNSPDVSEGLSSGAVL
ncbi:hypothetical protein N7509_003645 [Penicillium cosmopolitanum]|uniref:Xylanolytic transcriptional activator regulatory domain-containing protein n=1 Tax=Penicillium cosmopolitanum TaxID=1131564 RepID=A0A9W9W5C0_9EURO|nr:uncharacterized protein N7509_003645 [Penicillium cosmopolitanum]KAJ5403774.1 hypothetical protein N7509_003645 [Penicillium cosmopolitanum]